MVAGLNPRPQDTMELHSFIFFGTQFSCVTIKKNKKLGSLKYAYASLDTLISLLVFFPSLIKCILFEAVRNSD